VIVGEIFEVMTQVEQRQQGLTRLMWSLALMMLVKKPGASQPCPTPTHGVLPKNHTNKYKAVMYDRAYVTQWRVRNVRRALEPADRAQEVPAAGTSG
jgi:hypothetical protein